MSHKHLSWMKSAIRIVGFFTLPLNIYMASLLLVGAELLGIFEEVGQ